MRSVRSSALRRVSPRPGTLSSPDAVIRLPDTIRQRAVMRGGPVEKGRGFVLHSTEWSGQDTVDVGGRTAVVPQVTGMAYRTGELLTLDPATGKPTSAEARKLWSVAYEPGWEIKA